MLEGEASYECTPSNERRERASPGGSDIRRIVAAAAERHQPSPTCLISERAEIARDPRMHGWRVAKIRERFAGKAAGRALQNQELGSAASKV